MNELIIIISIILFIILISQFIMILKLNKLKSESSYSDFEKIILSTAERLEKLTKDEFHRNREEFQSSDKSQREELRNTINTFSESIDSKKSFPHLEYWWNPSPDKCRTALK